MATCTACGADTPEEQLNLTASGGICDACFVDADSLDMAAGAMARVRSIAITGAIATAIAYMVSMRSTQSSSFSMGGSGTRSVSVSADIPGLIGSGVALLAVLAGLYYTATTRAPDEASRSSVNKQRAIYAVVFIGVAVLAVMRLLDALPHQSTEQF